MTTTLSGKERGALKSVLKTRPIDLKLGRKGITENFINEAKLIISKDKMIKVSLAGDKDARSQASKELALVLEAELISAVGKVSSFYSLAEDKGSPQLSVK